MKRRSAGGAELRLTSGVFKGRRIRSVAGSRPTQGRVREALLSAWQVDLEGARLLELFCGSAAVSLEAVGRGAQMAVAVDAEVAAAKENVTKLGVAWSQKASGDDEVAGGVVVVGAKIPAGLARQIARAGGSTSEVWQGFDLVYADPPYDWNEWAGLFRLAAARLCLGGPVGAGGRVQAPDRGSQLVVEHSRRNVPADYSEAGLERTDQRQYGESCLSFFRRSAS